MANWIDEAMPKLRTKYNTVNGRTLTSALQDYLRSWETDKSPGTNLDAQRTYMIGVLDAIPVSHPATNAMALDDLRYLYWHNVTL